MPYPQRKNIRANFHDYSGGEYFVTICTADKIHFFGEIRNGEMVYTELGAYALDALINIPLHHKYAEVLQYVVMPNHIHAIICIDKDATALMPTLRMALGVVVGSYKQAVTMYARRNSIRFGWQKRFHDHVIRGPEDGNNIAEYIDNNVPRWNSDRYNTDP